MLTWERVAGFAVTHAPEKISWTTAIEATRLAREVTPVPDNWVTGIALFKRMVEVVEMEELL